MDIVPMIAVLGKGESFNIISYGGFQKNGRHYKFTTKNCCNIDKLSRCEIQIPDSLEVSDISCISEYIPRTELELLVVILLSINAFSQEIIDCYFDGEPKNANSIAYICELIKNNDSFIKKFAN